MRGQETTVIFCLLLPFYHSVISLPFVTMSSNRQMDPAEAEIWRMVDDLPAGVSMTFTFPYEFDTDHLEMEIANKHPDFYRQLAKQQEEKRLEKERREQERREQERRERERKEMERRETERRESARREQERREQERREQELLEREQREEEERRELERQRERERVAQKAAAATSAKAVKPGKPVRIVDDDDDEDSDCVVLDVRKKPPRILSTQESQEELKTLPAAPGFTLEFPLSGAHGKSPTIGRDRRKGAGGEEEDDGDESQFRPFPAPVKVAQKPATTPTSATKFDKASGLPIRISVRPQKTPVRSGDAGISAARPTPKPATPSANNAVRSRDNSEENVILDDVLDWSATSPSSSASSSSSRFLRNSRTPSKIITPKEGARSFSTPQLHHRKSPARRELSPAPFIKADKRKQPPTTPATEPSTPKRHPAITPAKQKPASAPVQRTRPTRGAPSAGAAGPTVFSPPKLTPTESQMEGIEVLVNLKDAPASRFLPPSTTQDGRAADRPHRPHPCTQAGKPGKDQVQGKRQGKGP